MPRAFESDAIVPPDALLTSERRVDVLSAPAGAIYPLTHWYRGAPGPSNVAARALGPLLIPGAVEILGALRRGPLATEALPRSWTVGARELVRARLIYETVSGAGTRVARYRLTRRGLDVLDTLDGTRDTVAERTRDSPVCPRRPRPRSLRGDRRSARA